MGLLSWIKKHPEEMEGVSSAIILLGGLLGRGSKAVAIAALLNKTPGRVDALKEALSKIDTAADNLEEAIEEAPGGAGVPAIITIELTPEELNALDDWLDLQSNSTRKLKKLAKRLIGK